MYKQYMEQVLWLQLDGCSHPGLVLQQCRVHNLRLNNLGLAPQVEVLVDLVGVQVGGEMAGSGTVGEWGAVRGMGPGDENETIRVWLASFPTASISSWKR